MMSELIENLELTKVCLRTAEVDASGDQWGIMCPGRVPFPNVLTAAHTAAMGTHMALFIWPKSA